MKLDAETAFAVRTPTTISGPPTNPSAPVAIPVTLPVKFPVTLPTNAPSNVVAVMIPAISRFVGNLSFARTGSLSLEIVPNPIFAPSSNVNSDPIPV